MIDAYDAMTSSRLYREALSAAQAREEIQHGAGTQFDPQVVDTVLQVLSAQELQVSIVPASDSTRPDRTLVTKKSYAPYNNGWVSA